MSTYSFFAVRKLSYHIPSVSWGVPDVVFLEGTSMCSISLPPINKIWSILNPCALFSIPSTPSFTLLTAICELYSSPVSNDVASFPICISAGSITNKWESLLLFLFIFGYEGECLFISFITLSLNLFIDIPSFLAWIEKCFPLCQ